MRKIKIICHYNQILRIVVCLYRNTTSVNILQQLHQTKLGYHFQPNYFFMSLSYLAIQHFFKDRTGLRKNTSMNLDLFTIIDHQCDVIGLIYSLWDENLPSTKVITSYFQRINH